MLKSCPSCKKICSGSMKVCSCGHVFPDPPIHRPTAARGGRGEGHWTVVVIIGTVLLLILSFVARLALKMWSFGAEPWPLATGVFAFAEVVLAFVVYVILSIAVHRDATLLLAQSRGRLPILVPPWVWAAATLVGGVVTAALYWFLNHGLPTPFVAPADEGEGAKVEGSSTP